MKKILSMLAVAGFVALTAGMRPVQAGGVYDGIAPGSSILGVRAGFSGIVGANVAYDYSLARVWKGSFTIGGQVGYMWNGHNWSDVYNGVKTVYRNNDHYLDFKVRTTYRFSVVVPAWEVYGGVGIGGGIALFTGKEKVNVDGTNYRVENRHGSRGFFSGAFIVGSSYYFSESVGVNLELDLGTWEQSWVNLGLNFKF